MPGITLNILYMFSNLVLIKLFEIGTIIILLYSEENDAKR